MTGEEFFNLKRGDILKAICSTPMPCILDKGDKVIVEYIDNMTSTVVLRNKRKPIESQVFTLPFDAVIGLFDTLDGTKTTEETEEPDNKTIHLPFGLNDEVWFMYCNKVCQGKIIKVKVEDSNHYDNLRIMYNVLFKIKGIGNTADVSSRHCYKTKEELIKSL